MRKLILAVIFGIPAFCLGGTYARINSNDTVDWVIKAEPAVIAARNDGVWVNTRGKPVSIGDKYDGWNFYNPNASTATVSNSTFTVTCDTCTE